MVHEHSSNHNYYYVPLLRIYFSKLSKSIRAINEFLMTIKNIQDVLLYVYSLFASRLIRICFSKNQAINETNDNKQLVQIIIITKCNCDLVSFEIVFARIHNSLLLNFVFGNVLHEPLHKTVFFTIPFFSYR